MSMESASVQETETSIKKANELCQHKKEELQDDGDKPGNFSIDEGATDENSKPNSASLRALNDGHITLQGNLRQALFELAEKKALQKDLEEDEVRQREKAWLLEERIRLMNEKLVCLKRCLERKEKKQDSMLSELAEVKWKLQEAKTNIEKLKRDYVEMQRKKQQRQDELAHLDSQSGHMQSAQNELQQDSTRLANYKMRLERGDSQMCAILNGNRMMELEQRKRALQDAIEERSARSESLYVEIDEKSERIQRVKKSLENAKKQHQDLLRDRKNHYGYLAETELRLQRSLDYLRSKIDYGTYKPAPWPNIRETLRLNNM